VGYAGIDPIQTERLSLEPWDESRREDFAGLAADPRMMRGIGASQPWSREESDERFDWQLRHWREHGFGWRSAIERGTGEWLGFVGINLARPDAVELEPDDVEMGWWVVPSAWGRGIATEGAVALRDEAFGRVGLDRLVARCRADNVASARVMEKIGMRFEHERPGRHGDRALVWAIDRAGWSRGGTPPLRSRNSS
jgi:RimJ/RimL family protein N-acetyltransferase